MTKTKLPFVVSTLLLLAGCGGGNSTNTDGGADTGTVMDSTMMGDANPSDGDAASNPDTAPTDSATGGDTNTDTSVPPDGPACAGMDCGSWAAALSAASSLRGAAGSTPDQALMNCVIQTHQSDCCGARHAYGFNHAARTQLCTAETACTMNYPASPGCTSTSVTTDTGETTTNPSQVRLRVVNPMPCTFGTCYTCETFVCTNSSCMSAPGIMPLQCG
jgi:hypothetical protein